LSSVGLLSRVQRAHWVLREPMRRLNKAFLVETLWPPVCIFLLSCLSVSLHC